MKVLCKLAQISIACSGHYTGEAWWIKKNGRHIVDCVPAKCPSLCWALFTRDPTLFLQSLNVKIRIITSICQEKKGELWEPK